MGLDSIASGFARAKAFVTGSDAAANTTTIKQDTTKPGVVKTTIKSTDAQTDGLPKRPPKSPLREGAALSAAAGVATMAPRSALPGALPGVASGPASIANSAVNSDPVLEGGAAVSTSLSTNDAMFAQIQEAALAQMRFQTQNAQLQSLTKSSEAVAKQIKNIGEGIKSTGAQ